MNEKNHSFNTANMDQTTDGTYYYMTTANYKVSQEMLTDPKKLAAKSVVPVLNADGSEKKDADGNTIYTSIGNDDWGNIQKLA